jgi:hypothetical protein
LNLPPPSLSFIPPPMTLIPGVVSTGIIFAFTYRYTQLLTVHPPTAFPHHLPLHWYQDPQWVGPVLQFCKRKKEI